MSELQTSIFPFLLICLIGFIALFSTYLRTPVMPLYAASLGADPSQVGIINGAFMLTAGLLSIPAGLLADRIGRKIPIIAGSLAIAISSLLIPLTNVLFRIPIGIIADKIDRRWIVVVGMFLLALALGALEQAEHLC